MSKYTYLAIRKPEELKGVYTGKENIKIINKKCKELNKEYSLRRFNEGEEAEALKWAGVESLTDTLVNQNIQIKEDNKIEPKIATNNQSEINEIELMINRYINKKYTVLRVKLINGEMVKLQGRDIYYMDSQNLTSCYNENSNARFCHSQYNSELGRYEDIIEEAKIEEFKNDIRVLKRTQIEYLKNGMSIKGYDEDEIIINNGKVCHSKDTMYIPYSSILYIEPRGFWISMRTKITDENLIKAFDNVLKEK